MKRLMQVGAGVAAVMAIGLAILLLTNPRVDLRIDQARAQQALDARLPIVHDDPPVKYRITAAAIVFRDTGRAELTADIQLKALGNATAARVTVSAEPYYADGAFYLRDFHADKTEILESSLPPAGMALLDALAARIPAKTKDKLRDLIEARTEAALREHPVYRLQPNDFKHTIARLILSDIHVESGRIDATLDPLGGGLRPFVLIALVSALAVALLVSIAAAGRRGR
jgi:hypothetical protein